MGKWLICLGIFPILLFAANGSNQGSSLYGSQSQHGQVSDCSHLSYEEQAFAAKLSTIHRNVFCSQFSPQQRQDTLSLVKMKDPYNTTPGSITPDHAVEIILQSSRHTGTGQSQAPNQQQMPQQYQPHNQQQQQSPYNQQQQGQQRRQPPSTPPSNQCKPY